MWVVRDEDSTIYLFGTVHMLRPETQWRTPRIDAAIKEATVLYRELADLSPEAGRAALAPLVAQHGLSPDKPLSSRLTPEEFEALDKAARNIGLTARQMDPFRPWFAAMTISASSLAGAGFDPESGVEMQIQKPFIEDGEPLRGLETLEFQLSIFAAMPPDMELAYLRETLRDLDKAPGEVDKMVALWKDAKLSKMEKMAVGEMKKAAPGLYKAMLVDRNAAWADEIATMLKGEGTIFVAVGAAHLLGPDSVQKHLKKKGIKAKRF
jgi:uncharacterized protein YbaP (TraB family)